MVLRAVSPDFSNVLIELQTDGYITLKIGIHEQGCGTLSSIGQIATEALQISPHKIIISKADTFITPYDSAGTHASRVTYVCGGALKKQPNT